MLFWKKPLWLTWVFTFSAEHSLVTWSKIHMYALSLSSLVYKNEVEIFQLLHYWEMMSPLIVNWSHFPSLDCKLKLPWDNKETGSQNILTVMCAWTLVAVSRHTCPRSGSCDRLVSHTQLVCLRNTQVECFLDWKVCVIMSHYHE